MRKPMIATGISAIAIFTAGLVAGQVGTPTLSFAASGSAVGTHAEPTPPSNSSPAFKGLDISQRMSAKSMKVAAHALAAKYFDSVASILTAVTATPTGDPRVVGVAARGPPDRIR